MREYRGKRIDNGEWVYGFGVDEYETIGGDTKAILYTNQEEYMCINKYEVDPKTVGQYITTIGDSGLYDQDVIETKHRIYDDGNPRLNLLVYEEHCWKLKAINDDKAATIPLSLYLKEPETIKLIGNRWDHPHLLGEDDTK